MNLLTRISFASINCHTLADVPASNEQGGVLESKKQKFTYSEVLRITKNFASVIGKGGFGTVYHGYLDGFQVAVKMLSPSSVQGYNEFLAEVGNNYFNSETDSHNSQCFRLILITFREN